MSKYSFYRPHDRAATWYTGEEVNAVTGEVSRPGTMTKQSFVAECDINNILKQYKQTGMIRHMTANAQQGMYADLPDEVDFQASMNMVIQAEMAFASLPSKVRARFHNSPQDFLEFMGNPDNQDEAIRLGLATRKPETEAGGSSPPPPPNPPVAAAGAAPEPQKGPNSGVTGRSPVGSSEGP